MVLATVPDAPPTRKKQRATSWPAPISAHVPYLLASRLIWSAFWLVSSLSVAITGIQYPRQAAAARAGIRLVASSEEYRGVTLFANFERMDGRVFAKFFESVMSSQVP